MPWNKNLKSGKNSPKVLPRQSLFMKFLSNKVAVILALVCSLAAILFFVFGKSEEQVVSNRKIAKKTERRVKTQKPSKPKAIKDATQKTVSPKEALREKLKKMTREEREEYAYKKIQERKIDLTPTTNRPFRTGIELSMARIFMTRVGDPPPPILTTFIPIQDEAHLTEILFANNPVIEGDSEQVKEAKATVEQVKKEMIAYIKDGGDPQTFMSYYHTKLQDAFLERRDSIKEVARVAIEEPEIAQKFYQEVNKRLESKGIAPIELTEKQKQRLGLE